MTFYRPKVYTASKIRHHFMWKAFTSMPEWNHVEWTARWIDMAHLEDPAVADQLRYSDFGHFWTIDVTDVRRSDFVLLFGEETLEAPLRGAVFEAGVAVALGRTVLAVALSDRHTWSHHPLVVRLDTLEDARKLLLRYCTVPPARILPQ